MCQNMSLLNLLLLEKSLKNVFKQSHTESCLLPPTGILFNVSF